MTSAERCPVHGLPLVPGTAGTMEADCVEVDGAYLTIEEQHFPRARAFAWGRDMPDRAAVEYCEACRAALRAWQHAPASWSAKAQWMKRGYDPQHGTPVEPVEATLVHDYVWVEKWIRAMHVVGGPFALPFNGRTLDQLILDVAAEARAAGAPLTAAYRTRGGWQTIDAVDDEHGLRTLMGVNGNVQ